MGDEEAAGCVKGSILTGRGLLELLTLLLPPFPGFEQTSQRSKLAAPANGRRVRAWNQRIRAHGRQPLHFLCWKTTGQLNSR